MVDFNSALYKILGAKIKVRREELQLSQSELSDKISGLGRTSISNIEKGRQQPPLHTVYQICQALDFDIQNILPTYSQILKEVKSYSSNEIEIEKYFNNSDIDESLLEEIKNLIKNQKDENL